MDSKFLSNHLSELETKSILPGLALFDFDGTLIIKDSLLEFLLFLKGSWKFYVGIGILSPILIFYKLGLIKNGRAKEFLLMYFIGGSEAQEFQRLCDLFSLNRIPKLIRTEALEKLRYHQSIGDAVYIITASPENWICAYAQRISVKVIATKLVVSNGKITGKLLGKNCYGVEKANRIRAEINLEEFDLISAYGDSAGDKEMLDLANNKFYRRFY